MTLIHDGRIRLTTIEFGTFKLDGGAMFGVVPRTLWGRYHSPDELNRIDMALRCLLVEFDNRKVLVDTGFGEGRSAKFKEIYAFTGSDTYLDEGLAGVGLSTEDITDVFLTHLHFDHCGGSTVGKGEQPGPAFRNANYYIQKRQLDHARSRLERDKASYFAEDFEPLVASGRAIIHDGEFDLAPGIDTIICNGHTPGMQLLRVKDGGHTFVYAADLIPLSSQFPLPWIMAYDLFPVTTLEEKKCILSQAVEDDWTFIFEHDPVVVSGKAIKTAKGFDLARA